MDTNILNFKIKAKKLDIEAIKDLIGLSESKDSIEVETNIGTVRVAKNNRVELGIVWINELQLLKNNNIKVTVSYPKFFNKNNSYEITRQADIETVQRELIGLLEKAFRTKIDIKNSRHTRIDYPINITKITDFREYRNIFILIAKALNSIVDDNTLYSGIDKRDKRIYSKGLLVKLSRGLDINFYNQRENIKQKTGEDVGETLRVETRYKEDYVIKKYFGTNEVKGISLSDIKEVTRGIIKGQVLDKLVMELQEEKDYLVRELKAFLDNSKRNDRDKLGKFVAEYQTRIFDYEIVSMAIGSLDIARQTKDKYREQAREMLKRLEGISADEVTYFNNFDRLNYLHYKLLGKEYKEFDIRP